MPRRVLEALVDFGQEVRVGHHATLLFQGLQVCGAERQQFAYEAQSAVHGVYAPGLEAIEQVTAALVKRIRRPWRRLLGFGGVDELLEREVLELLKRVRHVIEGAGGEQAVPRRRGGRDGGFPVDGAVDVARDAGVLDLLDEQASVRVPECPHLVEQRLIGPGRLRVDDIDVGRPDHGGERLVESPPEFLDEAVDRVLAERG